MTSPPTAANEAPPCGGNERERSARASGYTRAMEAEWMNSVRQTSEEAPVEETGKPVWCNRAIAKLALLAAGRRLGTVNPRRVPCEGIELRRVCVL